MNAEPSFPTLRMRRLRYNAGVRSLTRRTVYTWFTYPSAVCAGRGKYPSGNRLNAGQYQLSIDQIIEEAKEAGILGWVA